MIYLIGKVVLWIALAFLLGLWLGWWLRRFSAAKQAAELTAQVNSVQQQYDLVEQNSAGLRKEFGLLEQRLLQQTDATEQAERARLTAQELIAEKEVEYTQLAGECEIASMSLRRAQSEVIDRQRTIEELRAKLRTDDQQLKMATTKLQGLQPQVQQLTEINRDQLAELSQLRAEADTATAHSKGLQQQSEEQDRRLTQLRQSYSALEARMLQAQQRESSMVAQQQALTSKSAQADVEQTSLAAQLESAQQELVQVRGQLERMETTKSELQYQRAEVERLSQDVRKWRQRIPALQAEVDEKEMELRDANARLVRAERERSLPRSSEVVLSNRTNEQQKDARIARLTAKLSLLSTLSPSPPLDEKVDDLVTTREEESQPEGLLAQPPAQVDNLQLIKGIGPKLCALLNTLGIYTFEQIGELKQPDIVWLDDQLDFKGRVERDQWVTQAQRLALQREPGESV